MKKILFATTAIAVGMVAVPSFAAEKPSVTVRGYTHMGVGFGGESAGEDEIGLMLDGEIHVRWKGSSDNGLTFDGEIEIEAFSDSGDQIDEYWARVSGSFGSVIIGADDTAYNHTAVGVIYSPGAKLGYFDGFGYSGVQPGWSNDGDNLSIRYATPEFNGFSAQVSWTPDDDFDNGGGSEANLNQSAGDAGDNVFSVGAAYSGEFDAFSFSIGAGYETSEGTDTDLWRIGATVGFSGFTLAVAYEDNPGGSGAGQDLGIGASYKTGPWTVAGGYGTTLDTATDRHVLAGWVSYAVSPGVTATVGLEYGDAGATDDLVGLAYLSIGF